VGAILCEQTIKPFFVIPLKLSVSSRITPNEFTQVEIVIPEAIADQVSSFLIDLGSRGVWLEPRRGNIAVIGYLSGKADRKAARESTLRYLDELRRLGFEVGQGKVDLRRIEVKDWSEEWKKSFKPIFVTDEIVILPQWDKSQFSGKTVIRIKPGPAFGTGDHATTQLCIRALSGFVKRGDRVIDVGCGSGILSIVSVKLGAAYALGLDIDQDAICNAEENLALNDVERLIELRQGTANAGMAQDPFHVAVANINRIEIVESYDRIAPLVRDGGTLIFSGILNGEEGYMSDFFKRQVLNVIEVTRQDEWVCFVGRK
jgi:ribosomal protein L11 methyltransferase